MSENLKIKQPGRSGGELLNVDFKAVFQYSQIFLTEHNSLLYQMKSRYSLVKLGIHKSIPQTTTLCFMLA